MKTKLLFFGMLSGFSLSFSQSNQSTNAITFPILPVPITFPATSAPNEIFRFQPGNVTQLDLGTGFNFTNSRWFSMGKVVTGANTAYGLRFQLPNKSLTFGYQSVANLNPRVEWIGTGVDLGNLEFRVANSFTSTVSTIVATMTNQGNTIFGNTATLNSAKVNIVNNGTEGLKIQSSGTQNFGTGFVVEQTSGTQGNFGSSTFTAVLVLHKIMDFI